MEAEYCKNCTYWHNKYEALKSDHEKMVERRVLTHEHWNDRYCGNQNCCWGTAGKKIRVIPTLKKHK